MSPLRKVNRRILPFMFLLYIVSYLDRINVGFAALQLNTDLGFSASVFGFGSGIFFLGYFLFEIPSNLILQKVGARRWIARILVTWGLISSSMLFVRGEFSFYALRFLLGVAEAGFFPGMILYLTYWYPIEERGRTVATFMTATAIAGVVGAPVSGVLLRMSGVAGMSGWQWLFLLEGLPAIVLGFVTLAVLPDGPQHAKWLTADEKQWIEERLLSERERLRSVSHHTIAQALASGRIWLLSAVYFALVMSFYGVNFWLPQIVQALSGMNDIMVGILTTVPYLAAAVGMVYAGRHSDRTQERQWHAVSAALLGAVGLVAAAYAHGAPAGLTALSIAAVGIWSMLGPFWAMSSSFLSGTAAAAGIALINSVGNLGGFAGPYLVGAVRDRTHSFEGGMLLLALFLIISAGLTARIRIQR
jgi:ACS family tartrate transporter-like MFS transporter